MSSNRVQASGHLVEERLDEIEGVRKCVEHMRKNDVDASTTAMAQTTIARNTAHATTHSRGIDKTYEQ